MALFEDGVRQKIETFELVQIGGEATAAIQPLDRLDARTRVYMVFVDTFTARMSDDIGLRRNILRFIDRTVQPADLVGLMTPDMSAFDVVLGRKNTVMSDLANEERWVGRRSTAPVAQKDFQWENCYATGRRVSRRLVEMRSRRDARDTLASLRELVDRLREIREERKGSAGIRGMAVRRRELADGWVRPGDEDVSGGSQVFAPPQFQGDDQGAREVGEPSERLVLSRQLASPGGDAIGSSGDVPKPDHAAGETRGGRGGDQLRDIAEMTDGAWEPEMRGMERIATRIVDDTSNYYLLGYQSTNTRNDSNTGKSRSR